MAEKDYDMGYAKWHCVGKLLSGYKIEKFSRCEESKSLKLICIKR